jgi:hypothetical protein
MPRYIVWQEDPAAQGQESVRERLDAYPEVSILGTSDSDQAVVLMSSETEERIRDDHPELSIELDVQHRLAAG